MVLFTTEIKCCRCLPEASGVGNSLRQCPHDLVLLLRCKGIQRAPSFFTTTIPQRVPLPISPAPFSLPLPIPHSLGLLPLHKYHANNPLAYSSTSSVPRSRAQLPGAVYLSPLLRQTRMEGVFMRACEFILRFHCKHCFPSLTSSIWLIIGFE